MNDNNTQEKETQKENKIPFYAWIIGFSFSGALLVAIHYFNMGARLDFWDMTFEIICGAILSLTFGFIARYIFHAVNNASSQTLGIGAFIAALVLSILLPALTARYFSGKSREFRCRICSAGTGSESFEYDGGSICHDCLLEGLSNFSLGFCEHCYRAVDIDDTIWGCCVDCFDLHSPSSQSEVSVSATTAQESGTTAKPTETEKPTEPVKATTTPTTQPATTAPTHTASTEWNPWEDYKRRKAEEQKQNNAANSTQPEIGIVPEPASGTILYGSGYGTSEITVTASDSSSCVVMLKTPEGQIRLVFYVRAGDTTTVIVPAVCLYAYFATGDEWCGYGKGKMFGENTSYSKDDTLCDFSQYTYTYTLRHVYNGNFSETPCDEEDFFE